MIGGQALRQLGSPRHTEDTDYLICDKLDKRAFRHDAKANVDYCNANGNKFFAAVWKMEAKNHGPLASPQALIELKAYAIVQHYKNGNFRKAAESEHDIKWLVNTYGLRTITIVRAFITEGEQSEIIKIINEA
ncbi:MAG: hypothetical protein EOO39_00590 [Cytophagaceae bacterium]|nr:MAG: hypothetical protein EOO39_00590 [Cytophagaceae bacterium]